jgi:predicted amidohydrolase YtcJ
MQCSQGLKSAFAAITLLLPFPLLAIAQEGPAAPQRDGVKAAVKAGGPDAPVERIFHNGPIVTMDAQDRIAQAVAVRAGKVVAVGSDSDVGRLAGPQTELVDLGGRAMLPGFYAAHDHLPSAGVVARYQVDLNSPPMGRMESIDDIVAALREKTSRTPKGHWIVGCGYDDTLIRENRHPTREDLDRVSTEHPVWIIHTSGHLGVANSLALAIAGITKETPQPAGGVIRKDPVTGEPSGVIEEVGGLVARHIPALASEERIEAIRWCDQHYLSKGVTTTVIAGGNWASIEDLKEASARGWLHLRVVAMLSARTGLPATAQEAAKRGSGDRLSVGAIKMGSDGSIQGYTGYLTAPYHVQPPGKTDYCGYPRRSRDDLTKAVKQYHRAGYQIAIHGNGDAAIDDILAAFAEAQRAAPRPDARHRIEHCQMARDDQLDRMQDLGVTPSFFVGHVYYWGDRHRDIFLGPKRASRISPLRSALVRRLRFTLHNDTPVTPVDPLLLVWAAVNRMTRGGAVLGPDERISVRDALRAVTVDAAWQNFEEAKEGSIEPGKLADFVILSENPLTVPAERINAVRVVQTIVGGTTVYRCN